MKKVILRMFYRELQKILQVTRTKLYLLTDEEDYEDLLIRYNKKSTWLLTILGNLVK